MNAVRKPQDPRELAARALCRCAGLPENTTHDGKIMWETFLPEADAVIEALGLKRRDGGVLEYIPVQAYHLLRRLGHGSVEIKTLHASSDEGLVLFLVSRGLAKRDGSKLSITPDGKSIGEIEDER